MKSNKNRLLALFMVVMLSMTMLLSACGKESATGTSSDETTAVKATEAKTEAATTAAPTPEPKKIEGKLTVWLGDATKTNIELVIPDFKTKYPNVEIVYEVNTQSDIYRKMLLALSSGEGAPDIAVYESSNLAQAVETGELTDLTQYVAPYKDKISAFKWADATKDGKIYAMPWDVGPVALYYNRKIFEKAGYSSKPEDVSVLLKTWDEYYNVAKVIKEKTGSYMLSESKDKSYARILQMLMWQQNSWYVDSQGNSTVDNAQNVNSLALLGKLVKEDLAYNTPEWTQTWYDGFKNGKVATIPAAAWMGLFLQGWIAPDAKGEWGVVPLPAWTEGGCRTANDGGSNIVIPKQTKNFDTAWALTEYLLGDESIQLKIYKEKDIFPALNTTYSDPFFNESVEYYGGQAVRKVFADLVTQVPNIAYTKDYSIFNGAAMTATQKVYIKGMSAEQALKEAKEEIATKSSN